MEREAIHPWAKGWEQRISLTARSLGHGSVTELLASMPARPYLEVADRLGRDVAPIQVIALQFAEAKAAGALRDAAKDSLSRNLAEKLPHGWGTGERSDSKATLALSSWGSEILATGQSPEFEPFVDDIIRHFRRQPPPTGWRPTGPDDPVIVSFFNANWPAGDSVR